MNTNRVAAMVGRTVIIGGGVYRVVGDGWFVWVVGWCVNFSKLK